jgi:hypothetical protein
MCDVSLREMREINADHPEGCACVYCLLAVLVVLLVRAWLHFCPW